MMNCPKCGREIPDKPERCGECGARSPRYRASRLAVLSIVLSVLWCSAVITGLHYREYGFICPTLFVPILSLVIAIISSKQVDNDRILVRGNTVSNIGVVLSVFALVLLVIHPIFVREKGGGLSTCLSNVRQLGVAILMYMEECDDALPPEPTWYDALSPYIKDLNILHCPKDRESHCSYVYNSMLPRSAKEVKQPEKTVLFFEGECVWNGQAIFEGARRHDDQENPAERRVVVSFMDGHAGLYRGVPPLIPPDENNEWWKAREVKR